MTVETAPQITAQERLYSVCDYYDAESLLTDGGADGAGRGCGSSWTRRPGRSWPTTGSAANSRTSSPGR